MWMTCAVSLKLKSSMTLFAHVVGTDTVFQRALDKYFNGEIDHKTLDIVDHQAAMDTELPY